MVSCGKTHRLSDSDIDLIPYKENDILIFNSNDGNIDTISITRIHKEKVCKDYIPGINSTYFEKVFVNCENSNDSDTMEGSNITLLFEMGNYGDESIITFWFKGITKYGSISRTVKTGELINAETKTIHTNYGLYDDVIIIDTDSIQQENDWDIINRIYWSLKYGFIKLEINHIQEWTLVKKQ